MSFRLCNLLAPLGLLGFSFFLSYSFALAQAKGEQSANRSCDYFRQGPVEELPIALKSGWGDTLRREPTTILLDVDYIPPPRLPRYENEVLSEALYLEIDILTGLPPRTVHGENYYGFFKPKDWTRRHFSLLLQGYPGRPVWTTLGAIGGRQQLASDEAIEIQPGMFSYPIDGYVETGDTLAGFTGIEYPDGKPFIKDVRDLFIKKNSNGEIYEILNCKKPGTVKIPSCELHLKVEPFEAKARFERSRISDIDLVRSHTTQFTSCLLKE